MNTFGNVLYVLYRISFTFTFLFICVDLIKPGFIVNFSYIIWYILITGICGIATIAFYKPKKEKKSQFTLLIKLSLHCLLALLIGLLMLTTIGIENDYALIISMITGISYFLSVLLFYNTSHKFLEL